MQHLFQPRRELGRTGFRASVLGIGDLADRSVPIEDCVTTVRRAMDAGLNVIDTAPGYEDGYSEAIVGRALEGRRENMFVIDKIDRLDEPVIPQVEASLLRLGLETVDLFVFHGVSEGQAWESLARPDGGMDQLDRCRRGGKVRWRGISSHDPDVLRAAVESGLCDVVLFAVGPFCDPRYIDEILPLARRHGVGTVCFKTFGAGKLLGDTTGYGRPLEARPRGTASGGTRQAGSPPLPHLSVADCIRYALTCDPDVALLGLSTPSEQDVAFDAAARFAPFGPDEMADVRRRAAEAVNGKGPCWWNPPGPYAGPSDA